MKKILILGPVWRNKRIINYLNKKYQVHYTNSKINEKFIKNNKIDYLITSGYPYLVKKKIFSKVKKFSKPELNSIINDKLSENSLKSAKNDLEKIAMAEYPKLKSLKNFLENLSNIDFVRMTGSGSAIIGYFNSVRKCKQAEKKVKKKFRNYWCKTSKTI